MSWATLAISIAACLVGCHPGAHSGSASAIARTDAAGARVRPPEPDELAALAAAPAPDYVLDMQARLVDEWTLRGPFPQLALASQSASAAAATTDAFADVATGPWGQALARHLDGYPETQIRPQMACLGREVGRFALAHGARPTPELIGFMASRCGSIAVRLTAGLLMFDDRGESEESLYQARTDQLAALFEPIGGTRKGPRVANVWFGREHGKAVVVVVAGERWVELFDAARSPGADGSITLRGRFLRPATSAGATVARGHYQVRACTRNAGERWPRFEFVCAPAASDEVAWVAMASFSPERVLGQRALRLLLWPHGQAPTRYRRPRYGGTAPIAQVPDVGQAFVAAVNQERTRAGLSALSLASAQSATTAALTPHFLAARGDMGKAGQKRLDTIALGLLAGWDVPGTVHHGQIGVSLAPRPDVAVLLSAALESPFGRRVLLDPHAHFLAVGMRYEPATRTLAALYGTYATMEKFDRAALAETVWHRLEEARRRRGPRPPIHRLGGVRSVLRDAIAAIDAGRAGPDQALGEAILDAGMRVGRRVRGFWMAISAPASPATPGDLVFPAYLLEAPELAASLAVTVSAPTHDRPGEYIVLVLVSP